MGHREGEHIRGSCLRRIQAEPLCSSELPCRGGWCQRDSVGSSDQPGLAASPAARRGYAHAEQGLTGAPYDGGSGFPTDAHVDEDSDAVYVDGDRRIDREAEPAVGTAPALVLPSRGVGPVPPPGKSPPCRRLQRRPPYGSTLSRVPPHLLGRARGDCRTPVDRRPIEIAVFSSQSRSRHRPVVRRAHARGRDRTYLVLGPGR